MKKRKVVLYNPRAEGHTIPLALLALGSAVDRRRYEVRIKFYQQIAWARPSPTRAPFQALAQWRCRRDFYRYPIDKTMIEWLRPLAPQG